MDSVKLILRLIHIFSGAFWVGTALFMAFFVTPTVSATAESGQKFMAYLTTKTRLTMAISIAAILTVLAGITLYWIDSNGLNLTSGWAISPAGLGFGLGGIFAIIGLIFGLLLGRNISTLGTLGSQIQGKPTPEQLNQIQAIQKQLKFVGPISTISQVLALICMATARYW